MGRCDSNNKYEILERMPLAVYYLEPPVPVHEKIRKHKNLSDSWPCTYKINSNACEFIHKLEFFFPSDHNKAKKILYVNEVVV